MNDTDNNKTVLIIHKTNNSRQNRQYSHFIGESKFMHKALTENFSNKQEIIDAFNSAIKENKDGKFEIGNTIIYIVSAEKFPLYAHQYPLVVMKNDEFVDVDEYWYTPFKKILADGYNGRYTLDFATYTREANVYDILESGHMGKFTNTFSDDDVLYAVKTQNITFNMQD